MQLGLRSLHAFPLSTSFSLPLAGGRGKVHFGSSIATGYGQSFVIRLVTG
jgi:hypothetical protein